ncbi:hypothetical protein [Pseudoxanthomonas sp. USHLN014]|uniref:hypothetical protein n=1 Tax=Pseudoxanthomonas sp. USHLN014 TaxID=3081297 RepID=UPI00301CC114
MVTDDRDYLLRIVFRHKEEYTFTLRRLGHEFLVVASPGEHELQESLKVSNPSQSPDQILIWTRSIRDELRIALPVYSELDALREQLEKHVQAHIQDAQQPFSDEESAELRSKLDDLMAKFEEMAQRQELSQQEVNRLQKEVAAIKANLDGYPKGTWYKTAASKLWLAVSKVGTSKESRLVLAKAAQKLLGLDQ